MLFWDGEIHKTTLSSASWRALLLRAGFICAFFSLGVRIKVMLSQNVFKVYNLKKHSMMKAPIVGWMDILRTPRRLATL